MQASSKRSKHDSLVAVSPADISSRQIVHSIVVGEGREAAKASAANAAAAGVVAAGCAAGESEAAIDATPGAAAALEDGVVPLGFIHCETGVVSISFSSRSMSGLRIPGLVNPSAGWRLVPVLVFACSRNFNH